MADPLAGELAAIREHRWAFAPGDRVRPTGDWGVLTDALRTHSEAHPDVAYTVHETSGEGRWISLRDDEGRVYCELPSGIGPGYFRIVGDCGEHVRGYRNGAYRCMRCDELLPDEAVNG